MVFKSGNFTWKFGSFHERHVWNVCKCYTDVRTTYLDLLSKRRENNRLFNKIIYNLAVVPHSCLEKAIVRTRKNHSQNFCHIGYNVL